MNEHIDIYRQTKLKKWEKEKYLGLYSVYRHSKLREFIECMNDRQTDDRMEGQALIDIDEHRYRYTGDRFIKWQKDIGLHLYFQMGLDRKVERFRHEYKKDTQIL